MSIKAVNPSGGSGGFWNQRFLAAAGLPWALGGMRARPKKSFNIAARTVVGIATP